MCTLRRGYRLNDAQLAKKPGRQGSSLPSLAVLWPPKRHLAWNGGTKQPNKTESPTISIRKNGNHPTFDRTTVDYNEEGPIPNVAMRTLNY